MGTKNIFLTEFHEEILKRIKETYPNFNLSGYFQECLSKFGGEKMDESDILKKISDVDITITNLSAEKVYWRKKHEEFLVQKALREKEEKEKEAERLREIDYKEHMQKVDEYLKDLNSDNRDKLEEYKQGVKEGKWRNTTEFAEKMMNQHKAETQGRSS